MRNVLAFKNRFGEVGRRKADPRVEVTQTPFSGSYRKSPVREADYTRRSDEKRVFWVLILGVITLTR